MPPEKAPGRATLPIILLGGTNAPEATAASLGKACEEIGFAAIRGHGLGQSTIAGAHDLARAFFACPLEKKLALARRNFRPQNLNRYRGYFPLQPSSDTLKEGFELGPNFNGCHWLEEENVWPSETDLQGFREFFTKLYSDMNALGAQLMSLIARHLGLPVDHFEPWFARSLSTLRILHYPAVASHEMAAPKHVDSGILTLLLPADQPGLQIYDRTKKRWRRIKMSKDTIVMNLGGLLERWSGGRLLATPHRVKRPPNPRISIPFFYEPGAHATVAPAHGVSPASFRDVEYSEYLENRIRGFAEYERAAT